MGCIYIKYFKNNLDCVYVGSAVDIQNRNSSHLKDLRKNQHRNEHFQNAFNKYGEQNMITEIFENDIPVEDLLSWEQATFEIFTKKYNICEFAGNTYGQKNWLGKKHKQETKDKISQSYIGKILSVESKNKISISHTGMKYPQEYKDNMSNITQKTHCKRGHEFTEENTIIEFRKSNGRNLKRCKICRKNYVRNKKNET